METARIVDSRMTWCFFTTGFIAAAFVFIITIRPCYALQAGRIAGGFDAPLGMAAPPGDSNRIFVVEQTGKIRIINLPSRTVNAIPFLDVSSQISVGGEQGLLGMAF